MSADPGPRLVPARSVAPLVLAAALLAACASGPSPSPTDPLIVVEAWVDARRAGEVDAAMSLLADEGDIFGIGIHLPGNRERLRANLEAQTIAGWTIEETDCRVAGESVTCRYRQWDDVLRRWDLALTGEHRYVVRDGRLARIHRIHDRSSERTAYAAAAAFRDWVREERPELFDVIWIDLDSALYTTPDGARAVLDVLDEYEAATGGP
jgi:hypothetical protein